MMGKLDLRRIGLAIAAQLPQANQVVSELFAGPIPPLLGGRAGVGGAGHAELGAPQEAVLGAGGGGQHEQVELASSGGE